MNFETFCAKHKIIGFQFEQYLYNVARHFSGNYNGGYWESKIVENDESGFYLELNDNTEYEIINSINGYDEGNMDSKTFSLAISAFALNNFGFKLYEDERPEAQEFFDLFNFIMRHSYEILNDDDKHSQFHYFLD